MERKQVGNTEVISMENQVIKLSYYLVASEESDEENGGLRQAFGAEITQEGDGRNVFKSEKVLDITSSKDEINKIVHMLCKNNVTPLHLKDVIENMICL